MWIVWHLLVEAEDPNYPSRAAHVERVRLVTNAGGAYFGGLLAVALVSSPTRRP